MRASVAGTPTVGESVLADLERQIAHWTASATDFLDAEQFADAASWRAIEDEAGLPVRRMIGALVDEQVQRGRLAREVIRRARNDTGLTPQAIESLRLLRRSYSQVETTLEFFGDAVRTRSSPAMRTTLSTLDKLAVASMRAVLDQAGVATPPVLTYVDRGMGASIIRAGIRLWTPGSVNPVAAIKIVRHNLYRPTSLFHESGHQVAFMLGWVAALRSTIRSALRDDAPLASVWSGWASEIAADIFAFLHTGYASVTALHDVVGDDRSIFRWTLGDPHPIGWLRVLLGCALCRVSYGPGPWDGLEAALTELHPVPDGQPELAGLLGRSRAALPALAAAMLAAPVPGLRGRPMTAALSPSRVSPAALAELERTAGPALWTSPHWRQTEGIRIVALAGLREAERASSAQDWSDRARRWFTGGTPT